MKRHGRIGALRRLASAPRGVASRTDPPKLVGHGRERGRSPGFRIILGPTPSQARRPVDLSDFVPGYSGGGRAGITPASLMAFSPIPAERPHKTAVTGPVE